MNEQRTHRATSADGTTIVGRIHGNGPPLVLVPGAFADGETGWETLLPHLADAFTCYTMSFRGRGLSDHSDDVSPVRHVEDVTSFVDSIGAPTNVMGLSSGGMYALAAAEHSDAVAAVAAYEPPVFEIIPERTFEQFTTTIGRVGQIAQEGRLADAARTFIDLVTKDDEMAALDRMGGSFFDALAPNVAVQLREMEQLAQSEGPSPTDASELEAIDVPVLLLHGTDSEPNPWMVDGTHYLAEHIAGARSCEIRGTGHLAPIIEPEPVARELRQFFSAST